MCAKYYFIPILRIRELECGEEVVRYRVLGSIEFSEEEFSQMASMLRNGYMLLGKQPESLWVDDLDNLIDLINPILSDDDYKTLCNMLENASFVLKTYGLPPEKLDRETIERNDPADFRPSFVTWYPLSLLEQNIEDQKIKDQE